MPARPARSTAPFSCQLPVNAIALQLLVSLAQCNGCRAQKSGKRSGTTVLACSCDLAVQRPSQQITHGESIALSEGKLAPDKFKSTRIEVVSSGPGLFPICQQMAKFSAENRLPEGLLLDFILLLDHLDALEASQSYCPWSFKFKHLLCSVEKMLLYIAKPDPVGHPSSSRRRASAAPQHVDPASWVGRQVSKCCGLRRTQKRHIGFWV